MRFWRSLRVRLTGAFLLLAGSAVAVAAIATVLFVEQATLGTLDAMLQEEAETLASLVDLTSDRVEAIVHEVASETDTGEGKFVHISRPDGSVLAASRKLPRPVAARRPPVLTGTAVDTVGEDASMFRVAWAPTHGGGVVTVGVHASQSIRLVQRARWATAIVAGLLLLVLGVGAWTITGRATRELDRLAAEVATVEAGSLARRLSRRSTDEVDRLVLVLNRLLERLERSVAQLRRFTADAAHELRTPLAAMRARLEIALVEDAPAVPRDSIVDALEQAERLGHLAEDLLTLARVEGGAITSKALEGNVDVTGLVNEVGAAMAPVAEEQARPFVWSAAGGLRVAGSEPLLKRVLLNLVDNAFRHTPASARVRIDAHRDGGQAVLEVHDDGPGVDPGVRPHLFERFRHGTGSGSGLGLALVREIVERHRGTVTVDDAAPRGTRVRVALPLSAA